MRKMEKASEREGGTEKTVVNVRIIIGRKCEKGQTTTTKKKSN